MNTTATTTHPKNPQFGEDEFDTLVVLSQAHFNACVAKYGTQLFTCTADGAALYQVYLDGFDDAEQRQIHSCNCCRRFFELYGNLVFVSDDGVMVPAMWPEVDSGLYAGPMKAVRKAMLAGKVNGVFTAAEAVWKSRNGSAPEWKHFEVIPTAVPLHRDRLLTPYQSMAAKREDFNTVSRAIAEFTRETVETALQILKTDALYRSEKVIGQANWLAKLHELRAAYKRPGYGSCWENVLWREIAAAPDGFCHPRSSVIGSLLEDIAAGKPFEDVKRAFDAKMHPAQYQRPQAAPAAGNIKRAEEIVAKLGIAPSLPRRQARLDEMRVFWSKPEERPADVPKGGYPNGQVPVFGHLQAKGATPSPKMHVSAQTMTWEKFKRTVLPDALRIQVRVPSGQGPYFGTTTAVDADAPPIIQWDMEEDRNPVAWYLYTRGSTAHDWNLRPGQLADVLGISLKPSQWAGADRFPHQGNGVMFFLEGMKDNRDPSMCLFPEILKSDLHAVRATIEAFSNNGSLQKVDNPACGMLLNANGETFRQTLVVTTKAGTAEYMIDRFD